MVAIGDDGYVKFIYQLIYTVFKLLLHFPYPIQYIRHWNEITKGKWDNWGEKRKRTLQVGACSQHPQVSSWEVQEQKEDSNVWCAEWWSLLGLNGAVIQKWQYPWSCWCLCCGTWLPLSEWSWAGPAVGWCWTVCSAQGWLEHGSEWLKSGRW